MSTSSIEAFGILSVTSMAVFYALEERSPHFILFFAMACVAASLYAVMIQAWPFAGVELLWAGFAVRRWRKATTGDR